MESVGFNILDHSLNIEELNLNLHNQTNKFVTELWINRVNV